MSVNNVNQVDQLLAQMRVMSAQARGDAPQVEQAGGFSDLLKNSINEVNSLQQSSKAMKTGFELGTGSASLAEVMIAGQKANVAFQGMVEVRNKMITAYKDVMSMAM
jgi:flagellar hook-basal body complex protein FliE